MLEESSIYLISVCPTTLLYSHFGPITTHHHNHHILHIYDHMHTKQVVINNILQPPFFRQHLCLCVLSERPYAFRLRSAIINGRRRTLACCLYELVIRTWCIGLWRRRRSSEWPCLLGHLVKKFGSSDLNRSWPLKVFLLCCQLCQQWCGTQTRKKKRDQVHYRGSGGCCCPPRGKDDGTEF